MLKNASAPTTAVAPRQSRQKRWGEFYDTMRCDVCKPLPWRQERRSQCNDRLQAQQRRGRAGNGAIIPLALRFHPQRRPRFFKRDFHGPATDKPGQHLLRRMLQISRQQGLRFETLVRVSNQDPADGDRWFPRVILHGGVCGDLHLTWPFAIPLRNAHRAPLGPLGRQHRLQRRPAFALEPGPALGTRCTRGRGDHREPRQAANA